MLLGGWTTTRNRSWRRVKIPYGEEDCPKYVGTIFARSCSKRVQRDCVRRLTAVRSIHGTLRANTELAVKAVSGVKRTCPEASGWAGDDPIRTLAAPARPTR